MSAFNPACSAPACALTIPAAPSNAFEAFLASPDRAGRFIVEVDALVKSAAPITYPPLPACGAPACSLGEAVGTVTSAVEFSFSDHPVFMKPDDSLRPNYVPEARLARRVDLDTAFSIVPSTSTGGQTLIGDIEIHNADAYLDNVIANYAVDGRRVDILFGPENGAYSEFRIVESSFAKDWRGSDGEVRLTLQDLQFRLDQPYETATYAGTGGIEGDASITGDIKPRLIGYRDNFTPKLISAANNIYQISFSPIEEVLRAMDGGAEFTDSGVDVTTYPALISASIAEGEYATALNLGLIRIRPAGGSLRSIFTVRARGDNTGGYTENAGALILNELRNRAGFSDTELDSGSFAAIDGFQTGYYYDGSNDQTFRQVFSRLTVQTNGRIIADSRLRIARIVDPEDFAFSSQIVAEQIFEIQPEGVIYSPIIKTVVKYLPRDVTLTQSQILGSVTEPDFSNLQREYDTVSRRNGTTALRHSGAQNEVVIDTDLANEASATTLLTAVSDLWQTERMTYTITTNREGFFLSVGSVIKVTYPRFGFETGKNALIIRKRNDFNEQKTELRILV